MKPIDRSTKHDRQHAIVVRAFALFVGFWIWMMPQMLNARSLATPDEYGSRPAPVNEEEETKHLDLFEVLVIGSTTDGSKERPTRSTPREERPIRAPHGEVPHPPPWS